MENITQVPTLEEVAKVSSFSKFHFHRLFKTYTGETLNQFIRRIKLEQAAFSLLFDKERSITDVALSFGFSSSQNFATAFKKYFGMTPKTYKENRGCQGVIIHDPEEVAKYDIQLIFIDSFDIVYERSFASYSNGYFDAKRKEVLSKYPSKNYIGVIWDDPTIMEDTKYCRYDYGYRIDRKEKTKYTSTQTIEANTYIVLTLEYQEPINSIEIWNYLYANWLPRHGYLPNTLFCFESIEGSHIKFHIPIKKI